MVSDVDRLASYIASRAAKFVGSETGDPDADFFNLGGTSVDAVTLITQLARESGVQISLDEFFADAR
jgi:acyl carrier protein